MACGEEVQAGVRSWKGQEHPLSPGTEGICPGSRANRSPCGSEWLTPAFKEVSAFHESLHKRRLHTGQVLGLRG